MTDHHDFDDFGHFEHHEPDPLPAFEDQDHQPFEDFHWDSPDLGDHHPVEVAAFDDPLPADVVDTTDVPDLSEDPVEVFPPTLDIGDLPEPVDGFPWIDPAGLGPATFAEDTDPVRPEELADYAGTGAPADWQSLADSDDPATSALARWWSQN